MRLFYLLFCIITLLFESKSSISASEMVKLLALKCLMCTKSSNVLKQTYNKKLQFCFQYVWAFSVNQALLKR